MQKPKVDPMFVQGLK